MPSGLLGSVNTPQTPVFVTNNNDAPILPVRGQEFATVIAQTVLGGNAVSAEITLDSAQQFWQPAPLGKKISVNSTNQPWVSFVSFTPATGETYEFAIPGNCTGFRLRQIGAGVGTTNFNLGAGQPYVPGVPVLAMLFDVTSAVNTDNPTPVFDLSGWMDLVLLYQAGGATTGTVTYNHIYQDGGLGNNRTAVGVATSGEASFTRRLAGATSAQMLSHRMKFDAPPVAAQSTRMAIMVTR